MALTIDGFELVHTGGGCTALAKGYDSGAEYFLITNEAKSPRRMNEPVLVGLYTGDGDVVATWECGSVSEVLEVVAGRLPATVKTLDGLGPGKLVFMRPFRSGGFLYLHHFVTGWQELVFASRAAAERFARKNGCVIQ